MSTPPPELVQRRLLLPLLLVLGLILAGGIGFGALGAIQGPPLPGRPGTTPALAPASTMASEGRITLAGGRLTMPPWLSCRLPEAPFAVEGGKTVPINGLFTEAALSVVASDPHFVQDENWPPTSIVGLLEDKAAIPGDVPGTARGVLRELASRMFKGLKGLQLGEITLAEPSVIAGYPASRATVVVTGNLSSGAAERAEVSLLVLQLRADRWFGFAEARPEGMPADQAAKLDAARDSISPLP